ncbi:MAG: riboflavin synthase [Actinomycetota bacterium]
MFTGIVADRGEIVKVEPGGADLWIRSGVLGDCSIGASVAVDGVCLTVVDLDGEVCRFDVSAETVARSTLGTKEPGDHVNLERPLRAGDELGGHIVQGHVDAVGTVEAVAPDGQGSRLVVSAPAALMRYVVEKGSVTIDGVSLTVSALGEAELEVALVPHTLDVTTLGAMKAGRKVNIEVDVLAKYVEKLRADN